MSEHVASGRLKVQQVDPAELSPGELAHILREQVEVHGASFLVLDSLNGYIQAMPAEKYLYIQLHELLTYFGQRGVTTVMVLAQYGVTGVQGPAEVSYIADCVLLLRYFEAEGRVRKAISVIKKRTGPHEDTIRELSIDRGGVVIGQPLTDFRGVLTSAPEFQGDGATLLERPITPQTLITAVQAALRARRRQYQARAAIQQRDQFLAMLGHELRTPLGAIVLATELASSTRDRAKIDSRLELIARQSKLLARLVDDLLDVARVTAGKIQLRREAVDVDATIRGCVDALAERARGRTIALVIDAASGAVIEGDTARVEQVFNALLANAIKYSPPGRTVHVSSAVVGGSCEIRVRDQGIGIAPEMQRRVFDLFAQVDTSPEHAEGGMGIGLTLVDRLVRLHGGSVEVRSEGVGHGSEFIVRLPLGHAPAGQDIAAPDPARPHEIKVVLVEDNGDLRALTSDLLVALGCSVELANDGLGGVERIVQARPELALVDIGLPNLDGFGVAREVRRQLGDAPYLVAVTGYERGQDRERAASAGFDLFITKPLGADQARDLIRQALTRRRPARGA